MKVLSERIGECAGFGNAGFEGEVLAETGRWVERATEFAGDVDAVAGLCAGAEDRAAGGVRAAEDGDGECERVGLAR